MSEPLLFGRYALERRLAVGGMAEVHLARIEGPEGFRKQVVVKRLLPELAAQPELVQLFLREARLAARFQHPGLIQVYELFELAGQYAIVMEYLQGVDVAAILHRAREARRARLGDGVVAFLVAEAAAGLHAAHELRDEQGLPLEVVHRDVSPTNIFVTWQGGVKVVDFGIAKTSEELWRTSTASLRGKVAYMSPEQARGERIDRTSDVFSLGVVLYELLTQEPCFDDDDEAMRTLDRVREGAFRPLTQRRPDTPLELARVASRMLAVDRRERYPGCDAVRRDLMSFVRSVDADPHDLTKLLSELFPDHQHAPVDRAPTAIVDLTPEMLARMTQEGSTTVRDELRRVGTEVLEPPRYTDVLGELAVAQGGDDTAIDGDWTVARSTILDPRPRARPRRWAMVLWGLVAGAGVTLAALSWQQAQMALPDVAAPRAELTAARPQEAERGEIRAAAREPHDEARDVAPAAPVVEPEPREGRPEPREAAKEHRPARAAPPPSKVARVAFLSLSSTPATDVLVNGKRVGRTPLDKLKVEPGKLTVQLRDAELGIVKNLKLAAEAGETVEERVTIGQGQLVVDARPWAEVYLGSRKLGTTPLAPLKLYEGTYSLRLVNPQLGTDRKVSVTVQAGQTAKVIETMAP